MRKIFFTCLPKAGDKIELYLPTKFSTTDKMNTIQHSFAEVYLDRNRKKVEINWLQEPDQEDYSFLMNTVKRLMDKHRIQQLIQNNLHS